MEDFYKGYYEDHYSFGHADKKWYSQNKDHVKQYNHDYYQKHKKSFLSKDVDTTVDDPDQLLNDTEVGQIIRDQNGQYYVHTSPQYYTTPDDQKKHYLSSFWSGEAGNNLASAILYSAIYRNADKRRKEYAKQDMDKVLDILHRFGSKGSKPVGYNDPNHMGLDNRIGLSGLSKEEKDKKLKERKPLASYYRR